MPKHPAKTLAQIEKELEKPQAENKRTAPKELVVSRHDNGLYVIGYTAGGEVPNELKGFYTNINKAINAVDNYKLKASSG